MYNNTNSNLLLAITKLECWIREQTPRLGNTNTVMLFNTSITIQILVYKAAQIHTFFILNGAVMIEW